MPPLFLSTPVESGASAAALAEGVQGSPRWADLGRRTASAAVLAPLAIGAIWAGGWLFGAVIAAAAVVLGWEWLALARALPGGRPGLPSPSFPPKRESTCKPRVWWRPIAVGMTAVRPPALAGLLWIALWAAALIWLRADPAAGRINVIGLALIVWGTDIGAYATGRLIGGPRLAPRISPGKTWAGAIGGAAAAAGIAAALGVLSGSQSPALAAPLGLLLSVLGQASDLAESAVKRRCGVKDSGRLIPGHGGLLDRLDATLAVVPVAALLALAFGRGVVLWQ